MKILNGHTNFDTLKKKFKNFFDKIKKTKKIEIKNKSDVEAKQFYRNDLRYY